VRLALPTPAQDQCPQLALKLAASAAKRSVKVAFIVTDGSVMIDFARPWDASQDVVLPPEGGSVHDAGAKRPFDLFTVSDTTQAIGVSGGMQIVPDYTFDDAPRPNIVVIPAQHGHPRKMLDWIGRMADHSDVVMARRTQRPVDIGFDRNRTTS
jgi:hypothetical protein